MLKSSGLYDQDLIDDETLQLIINPNNQAKFGYTNMVSNTVFDYIHPNCMVFNTNGRLFVGDSRGRITAWDISIRAGSIYADNFFQIRQKELEGDEINSIHPHPEHENKLFIHSRDNCIRLLEYESMKGPRIRKRFFGSKCKDLMVRSCVSPDGQFIVAGSEEGVPHVWNAVTEEAYGLKVQRRYECRFLDLVSDISWNPRYNMFALSGFGHHFPVMVYVYQRTEEQLNEILYSQSAAATGFGQDSFTLKTQISGELKTGGGYSSAMGTARGGKENDHFGNVNVTI